MLLQLIVVAAVVFVLYKYVWLQYYRGTHYTPDFLRGKIVFISGCDSGFGERTALELYKRGLCVFAACLTDQGVQNLTKQAVGSNGTLTAIKCNITKDEDVMNAHEVVSKACTERGDGLWALINNAGLGSSGPVEWTPLSTYEKIFSVNFFGHVRVTKAFLPLVRKNKGRVINITSMAGCVALPSMSAYAATKHALEAFHNSLRRELEYFGCYVVCVAPFFMRTPIINLAGDELEGYWNALTPDVKKDYGATYPDTLKKMFLTFQASAESPQLVVDVIRNATTLQHPAPRYIVGGPARKFELLTTLLPTILFDYLLDKELHK